jgi:Phospholipase_D-nuclease N-terminal/Short C-terminal domain
MLIAEADFPFLEFLWSMMLFFAWLAWIWIAVTCFMDILRRNDIGGGHKALWVVFIILIPFLGVLVYLVAQHDGMRERSDQAVKAQKAAFDDYVREAAGGPAAEIAKAKELLDSGTITQAEFDAIKAKATA